MATIERQLQLEGRVVRILVTVLLLSWVGGAVEANHILKLQGRLDNLQAQRDAARARANAALWVAEDQRLAVRACYSRQMVTWRGSVIHLVSDN
ncbi:MAG TPA: hypothetical protein VKC56_12725 [Gallionellaceae bacterium]|nr:hypothetical protein [Gallionellaceae bacterium]